MEIKKKLLDIVRDKIIMGSDPIMVICYNFRPKQ